MWRTGEVIMQVIRSTKQEIHATLQVRNTNLIWLISAVYGSPRLVERKLLWSNLEK